jgi:hypothetical protein
MPMKRSNEPKDRAVQHDRAVLLPVLADIFRAQPVGQVGSAWKVPHCHSRPMASVSLKSSFGP